MDAHELSEVVALQSVCRKLGEALSELVGCVDPGSPMARAFLHEIGEKCEKAEAALDCWRSVSA